MNIDDYFIFHSNYFYFSNDYQVILYGDRNYINMYIINIIFKVYI